MSASIVTELGARASSSTEQPCATRFYPSSQCSPTPVPITALVSHWSERRKSVEDAVYPVFWSLYPVFWICVLGRGIFFGTLTLRLFHGNACKVHSTHGSLHLF